MIENDISVHTIDNHLPFQNGIQILCWMVDCCGEPGFMQRIQYGSILTWMEDENDNRA